MKKIIILSSLILLLLAGVIFYHFWLAPRMNYTIEGNEDAINRAIHELTRADQEIRILLMKDVANKKVVLFSLGPQTGEAVFERGRNDKWMIETAGFGTNPVHSAITDTSDGQYIRYAGVNPDGISRITAFVEEESYDLEIEQGEYFIVFLLLRENTEYTAPTGSIFYNEDNEEIYRTGEPKDTVQ